MELSPSSKYVVSPNAPVDEAERASLSDRLAAEFEAGRLQHDEYARLLDELYEARTQGELVPVVKAVPDAVASTPAIVGNGGGRPGDLAPISNRSALPAVMIGTTLALTAVILIVMLLVLL